MEDGREDDLRVPLISSLFCLCVTAGGIFLVLYVFVPSLSQPWFPVAALILIGSPWLFWLFTYLYTCVRACYWAGPNPEPRGPQTARSSSSAVASSAAMQGRRDSRPPADLSSTASSRDSDYPLAYSV